MTVINSLFSIVISFLQENEYPTRFLNKSGLLREIRYSKPTWLSTKLRVDIAVVGATGMAGCGMKLFLKRENDNRRT